jgi:Sigma-70, region 4
LRLMQQEFSASESWQDPEVVLYRDRAIALLLKYFRMSVELGHLPSLLGREFFRSHVTSYGTHTFEDAVIFVHDVERCIEAIDARSQVIITRLFFQQYSIDEAARLMHCAVSTIERHRAEALNALTAVLLARKLLDRMPITGLEPDGQLPDEQAQAVPKKPVRGVSQIHAVAVLA